MWLVTNSNFFLEEEKFSAPFREKFVGTIHLAIIVERRPFVAPRLPRFGCKLCRRVGLRFAQTWKLCERCNVGRFSPSPWRINQVGSEGEVALDLPLGLRRPCRLSNHAEYLIKARLPHLSSSIRNPGENSFLLVETKLERIFPFFFFNWLSFHIFRSRFQYRSARRDIISLSFGALMTSLNYLSIVQWDQSLRPLPSLST